MAQFSVTVFYHYDTTYEVEAGNFEEAKALALAEAEEWLPYSSEKGYTDNWYEIETEVFHESGELDD